MYCLVPYLHQDEFAQALDATDTGTHTTEHLQLTLVTTSLLTSDLGMRHIPYVISYCK